MPNQSIPVPKWVRELASAGESLAFCVETLPDLNDDSHLKQSLDWWKRALAEAKQNVVIEVPAQGEKDGGR